jgi:hypothetical protein
MGGSLRFKMKKLQKIIGVCLFISCEMLVISFMSVFFWYETPGIRGIISLNGIRISPVTTIILLIIWGVVRSKVKSKQLEDVRIDSDGDNNAKAVLLRIILFLAIPVPVLRFIELILSLMGYVIGDAIVEWSFFYLLPDTSYLLILAIIVTAIIKRDVAIIFHSMLIYICIFFSGGNIVLPMIIIEFIFLIIMAALEKNRSLFIKQCLIGVFRKQYLGLAVILCIIIIFTIISCVVS